METWAIVTLVLGSSAISSLLTFCITKMQVRHSDRRFEKELERAREVESRQRRWQVRGEPLLKLRAELAIMATKQDRLVAVAYKQHTTRYAFSEEELERVLNDSNSYLASGNFANALFILGDAEIVNKAKEILSNYQKSYANAINNRKLKSEELSKDLDLVERNRTKIIEVQELINKRLEEL